MSSTNFGKNHLSAYGETEISIYEIPSRYVFPTYSINQYYYYKEPGDIKFELMTYEEWNQKIQLNHK